MVNLSCGLLSKMLFHLPKAGNLPDTATCGGKTLPDLIYCTGMILHPHAAQVVNSRCKQPICNG